MKYTVDALIDLEMRLGAAACPDGQRTVRDERLALQVATQRRDTARIVALSAEATRVARMWEPYAA